MTIPKTGRSAADLILTELIDEIMRRQRAGEQIDLDAYASEYPECVEQLHELLPTLEVLADFSETAFRPDSPRGVTPGEPVPQRSLQPLGTLGDFRVLREIGRGGMGIVYEAEQISLGRRLALKVLPFAGLVDPKQLARFQNEARAAASLDHPNIVSVYSVGCERAVHFYAMKYVEGQTLARVIEQLRQDAGLAPACSEAGGLSPGDNRASSDESTAEFNAALERPASPSADTQREPQAAISTEGSFRSREFFCWAARLGIQAAEALEHAHQMGVVHRDIKPSNLMVDSGGHLWVTDFGLAMTQTETNLTMTGDVLGTLRYMSPEQVEGRRRILDHRTDVYSLGVTLYELLTLQPALVGRDRRSLLRQLVDADPRPPRRLNPAIPAALETIVLKAIAKEPQARYRTAQEMADDLRRFLEHKPIRARRASPLERLAKWSRRHVALVWMAIVLLSIVSVGLTISVVLIAKANREKAVAVREKTHAYERERQQRETADRLRAEAENSEFRARTLLYATQIRLAYQAWQSADLDLAVELLSGQKPALEQEDVRGFEWYYLWGLCHPDCPTLRGHTGDVYCCEFSPDGRTIATASHDGTVMLWDVASGTVRLKLEGHEGEVNHVAFSPDGARLATSGDDDTVRVWEADTGRWIATLRGHTEDVFGVAFSPDGSLLASGGCDDTVKLWETSSFQETATLCGHTNDVESLAFSPDGKTLATASSDNTVQLWDPITGEQRTILRGHTDWVASLAFSHDGQKLATASKDLTIKLWSLATEREEVTFEGHQERIHCVAFSPDDRTLASSSKDATVRLWDAASGELTNTFRGHYGRVWYTAFSPDGEVLATAGADKAVRLWDPQARQECKASRSYPGRAGMMAFSPDGRLLVNVNGETDLKLWDFDSGREQTAIRENGPWTSGIAFFPNGRTIVSGYLDIVCSWNADTGEEKAGLGKHAEYGIHALAVSPDGRMVASGGADDTVRVWDVETQRQREVYHTSGDVNWVAFSPDGRVLAAAVADGSLRLWDATSDQQPTVVFGHDGMVRSVAFSPNGTLLATAGDDRAVRVWDPITVRELWTLVGHGDSVASVAFSGDGKTLASGSADRTVKLWSTATGQELITLEAHRGAVLCVAFSPDGTVLASSGETPDGQGEVYLWAGALAVED